MSTASARSLVAPIAMIFSLNDRFVLQAMQGLTHEELWRVPTDRNNSMLWVAGHVVQTRAVVLQMFGERVDTGGGNLFDRGAKVGDAGRYPSGTEVARVMREVSPRLHATLAALKDEQLSRPASQGIPGIQTLADELAFFALHDSYQVGQMAYIRKRSGTLGLPGDGRDARFANDCVAISILKGYTMAV